MKSKKARITESIWRIVEGVTIAVVSAVLVTTIIKKGGEK
jgi:hypothetical protein